MGLPQGDDWPERWLDDLLRDAIQLTGADQGAAAIPEDMTFRDWCQQLADQGLKVDNRPFTLDNRPALTFIYDLIPSTVEEAAGRHIVVMKGSQLGLTVWEILADLYLALKFAPVKIGMYVPDRLLAGYKSSHRFKPIVESMPEAIRAKLDKENVLTRTLGLSEFLFLWTSSSTFTESFPLDVLSFDEVQQMLVSDMERTIERLSASAIKLVLMLSTAKWPDADIHWWYQRGTRHRFHTDCACPAGVVLDEHIPEAIQYRVEVHDYRYQCPTCRTWIDDPQRGEWRAEVPEARIISCHLPQTLSPTISAREMLSAWENAEDLQSFHNRKLGRPYADPSQSPVTLEMLNRCVEAGAEAGITWQSSGTGTLLGIDQMGKFNAVIVKQRLPDGRQAVIHVESIYDDDPFARCSELMEQFDVAVCVVESLPNYNDAKRFAGRHRGRVFLAHYQGLAGEMIRWGDAVVTKADRKTDAEERDRYTVALDHYKMMQTSLARIQATQCLFPDPQGLHQDILVKGRKQRVAILKDEVFLHLTKVALITEADPHQPKKMRRKVEKVGIDPHYAFANALCDVAWSRINGSTQIFFPERDMSDKARKTAEAYPGLPAEVVHRIQDDPTDTCGSCLHRDGNQCTLRGFLVRESDPGCPAYVREDS